VKKRTGKRKGKGELAWVVYRNMKYKGTAQLCITEKGRGGGRKDKGRHDVLRNPLLGGQ